MAHERRTPAPLVRLGILRSGALVRANIGAMSLIGGWFGFQFIVTLYMQQLRGWSALETGLALFPAGLLVAVLATRLAPLIARFGVNRLSVAGLASTAAGYALFLPITLLLYWSLPHRLRVGGREIPARQLLLLLASYLFYWAGAGWLGASLIVKNLPSTVVRFSLRSDDTISQASSNRSRSVSKKSELSIVVAWAKKPRASAPITFVIARLAKWSAMSLIIASNPRASANTGVMS